MNLVTIMNFVRGVEPRNPNLDLLEPAGPAPMTNTSVSTTDSVRAFSV